MSEVLTTERLILRPASSEDAAGFFPILSDSRNMRFMPEPPHQTVAQTDAWLDTEMSQEGAHFWTIGLRGAARVIGFVNFLGETRIPGMGYLVDHRYRGRGYAPEACRPVLDYGFERLAYDRVELWIDETNAASLRVAQKLAFQVKGRIAYKFRHNAAHHFMLVYGLLAQEWQADGLGEQPPSARFFGVEPILKVLDVGKTARYYRDALGFTINFLFGEPPVHASVSRGDWTGSMATLQLSQAPAGHEPDASDSVYLLIDTSLDALCEAYRARGAEIVTEPADRPWGMREFTVRDLDGHVLVFGTQS